MPKITKTWDQADQDEVTMSQYAAENDLDAFWSRFLADLGAEGPIRLGRALEQYRKDRERRESRGITDPAIPQNIIISIAIDIWRHWNWHETVIDVGHE